MKSNSLRRALLQQCTRVPRHRLIPPQNLSFHSSPFAIFDEFNRVVDEAFGNRASLARWVGEEHRPRIISQPRLDLRENPDNTITAIFELPGLRKEDVSIELHDGLLTIRGEHSSASSASDVAEKNRTSQSSTTPSSSTEATQESGNARTPTYIVRERQYGGFSRSIHIPKGTDPKSIKASVENGILTVTFPRAKSEAKRIEVS